MTQPNRLVEVLHKFTQEPSAIQDAIVIGTGTTISFTPTHPFKCSNILIWYSKQLIIKQITIGPMKQLVIPNLPGITLAAPVTLQVIEEWLMANVLRMMLNEHHVYPLVLSIINPTHPIKIEFEGNFDVMALYGVELLPTEIQKIFARGNQFKGRLQDIYEWRNEINPKIIQAAQCFKDSNRALCPLCTRGPENPLDHGFTIPEGLLRHLNGSHNFHRCEVMAIAEYLMRKGVID